MIPYAWANVMYGVVITPKTNNNAPIIENGPGERFMGEDDEDAEDEDEEGDGEKDEGGIDVEGEREEEEGGSDEVADCVGCGIDHVIPVAFLYNGENSIVCDKDKIQCDRCGVWVSNADDIGDE